jgi:hypothetical protein
MPAKPVELPPEVAKAFVRDMRAFFAAKDAIKRDEIASRQIHVLRQYHTGGRGGIRTHGTLAGTPVFKTGALNHSATLPVQ